MLHQRIPSVYNYKKQDVDKKEKDDKLDKHLTITSQIEKVQPNYAKLTINSNNADDNKTEQRHDFKTGVSVCNEVRKNLTIQFPVLGKLTSHGQLDGEILEAFRQNSSTFQQSIVRKSEKLVQMTTKHSVNVVQLLPHSPAQVYQVTSKSCDKGSYVASPSTKGVHGKNAASVKVGKLVGNSAASIGKPSVSHSSGKVVKLVPHSSTRVAQFVPTSSTRVTHLVTNVLGKKIRSVPNFPKDIPSLVPTPSPRLSQLVRKSSTKVTQLRVNVPLGELMSSSSSGAMQLFPNSPAQLSQCVASTSSKLAQNASCSPKKVPPLIKFSLTQETGFPPNSQRPSVPRALSKPSIKSIQRLTKGDNNSNVVMVLPVPGREATMDESQTICRLEKIQHWKDVTRIQQVIGVQRQHCTSDNNPLENDSPKLAIVTPKMIEPRSIDKDSSLISEGGDNVGSGEIAEKVVIENEKSPGPNNSRNDFPAVELKLSPAAHEIDTSEQQPEVEVVDTKETTTKSHCPRKRSRTSVPNGKKPGMQDSGNATTRTTTRVRKSTILSTRRRNTRSVARPNQAKPQISALARMQGQLTKTLASLNIPARNKWRAQCIICKDRFTDKYEFHRHVTLSHPGIRVVFCELCNASFRTDIELRQHRYSYHKITVTKDAKNNLIKLEAPIEPIGDSKNKSKTQRPKPKNLDERRSENCKEISNRRGKSESMAGRSKEPFRSQSSRKRVTASCMQTGKSRKNSQPNSVAIGPQRRKSQKKTKNRKSSYVDIDIIDHRAIATNETLIHAEKRKLIIPIVRLEGPALEKYSLKSSKPALTTSGSTGIGDRTNSLKSKKKPAVCSSRGKKLVNSRSSRVSNKSVSRASRLIARKRRRTLLSKKMLGDEKNLTICHDPQIVQQNIPDEETPLILRRSLRSRKATKPFDCSSEEKSNNGVAKMKPLDESVESTMKEKSGGLGSDISRSSQDFTLIYVDDEPEVAEIVAEQQITKKLVSRSSVSRSSTTIDDKLHKSDSDPEILQIKDGKREGSIRSSRENSKLENSQSPGAENSTFSGSEESVVTNKRSPKKPRFSCLDLYDIDSSNNSHSSENRDGEPEGISNEHDRKAVVNKNVREKNGHVSRRRKGTTQVKAKSDDQGQVSEEKIDGEDNGEKNQNGSDGKNVDEKSSGSGKGNNGNSNEGKQYSKASPTDTLRKKRSDDEDEDPKRRITDESKKLKEKIEDEEEAEKMKDGEKQLDGKSPGENEKLGEESKHEESTRTNDFEHSNDVDDQKSSKNKNVGVGNRKETEKSSQPKTSSDLLELPVRKTYSSSKKLCKTSKQCQRSGDKIEKFQDLCTVCKELSELMKKVSSQVGDRNTTEIPIKCPLCQRYFISMFHLELHVATNHLQCQHKIPCKIAKSPIFEKPSTDIALDCETRIDIAIECLRCSMKFPTEKDLNDHLIAKHEIRYPNDKSSKVHPEYIRDLRTSLLETNGQKNVVASSKSSDVSGANSTSETYKNKITPATLDCSLCDEKFIESTKYVRHVREIHNTSKASSALDRKRNSTRSSSNRHYSRSLFEEPSPNVSEGSSTVDNLEKATGQADPVASDRDYVLKQLLSDNSSSDGDDADRNSGVNRPRESSFKVPTKKGIVPKSEDTKIADGPSSLHICEICQKTFKRVQDLLSHGVSHVDSKIPMIGENDPKTEYEDRSEVFVLSDSEDEGNHEDSEAYDEFSPTKERVFVYHRKNECDNVAVVFGTNGASEKVLVGSKRRSTLALSEMSENSGTDEKEIPVKKHKISSATLSQDKSVNPAEQEPRDARKSAMKQLIETEVGLTDEIRKKLPIACGKCNRHFANRSLLNEHLFFLHDDSLKDTVLTDVLTPVGGSRGCDEGESSQGWKCETCLQKFKLFQGYSRHRYYVHGDDSMVHVCENCSKVMTNVTLVNVHICTDVASYNCRTCNETFPTGMSLRLHNTEKHMEKNGPHNCEVCKRNFLTNGMLERHRKGKHGSVGTLRSETPDTTIQEDRPAPGNLEKPPEEASDKTPMEREPGQEEDSILSCDPFALRRGRWRTCRSKKKLEEESPVGENSPNLPGNQKRRGRPRKNSSPGETSSKPSQERDTGEEKLKKLPIVRRGSSFYVDEAEIYQCALCQLYCLSRSTLRNHMAKIHSTTDEICQLCQKMYPTGKLIRHLIDRHITSENGEVFGAKSSCRIGTNSNEIDAEILIKMLGIDRLVSLCEYRRYSEKTRLTSYPCASCNIFFASHELYKYHFLLHHDAVCALCNIEFKSGQDAARHKSEIHGSAGRYIWFADRTIVALTSATNFTDTTETIFMERITKEEKASNDENEETTDGVEEQIPLPIDVKQNIATFSQETTRRDDSNVKEEGNVTTKVEIGFGDEKLGLDSDTAEKIALATKITEKSIETSNPLRNPISTVSSEKETSDLNFIIVVTDDDLKKFNIATRHPNIWGLAAKISSTCEVVTPKQIKEMLERHFEREEDFDT